MCPLACHLIISLIKQYEIIIPVTMPSFNMMLIGHKTLHFMRAVGLNAWRTGMLCEWERSLGQAVCFTPHNDISVWEVITMCRDHSCLMCDD